MPALRSVSFKHEAENYRVFRDTDQKIVVTGYKTVNIFKNGSYREESVRDVVIDTKDIIEVGTRLLLEEEEKWAKEAFERKKAAMDHEKKLADICSGLPQPIAKVVKQYAYDRGHSGGYSEVEGICEELANDLEPACKEAFQCNHVKKSP